MSNNDENFDSALRLDTTPGPVIRSERQKDLSCNYSTLITYTCQG